MTVTPNKLVARLPGGIFTVVRTLPEERGVWQYRIASLADGHERVVFESDLGGPPATAHGDFLSGDGSASG
ncbi:MAG TPA: hypothetical protein VJO12_16940 [Stellaceae bacterium]|nr:hypothetical protein [Stellaceae bacterium]